MYIRQRKVVHVKNGQIKHIRMNFWIVFPTRIALSVCKYTEKGIR